MKRINISDGVRFGMGADSHTEEVRGNAIAFNGIERQAGGQIVTSEVEMLQSQESLMESLNISVSASVRYGLASVDAKFDFAKTHAVNGYATYLLLKARVQNPPQHMVGPTLTPEATAVYQRSPEEFRQTFGDVYIDEIYSGGEFYGLFTFESRDESTRTEISAKLDISVGSFLAGGGITAAFSSTVNEVSRKSRMSINVFRSGGIGLQNPTNMEQLNELYQGFNAAAGAHGINYQAAVKDFRFLPLPAGPTWVEQEVRQQTVAALGRYVVEGWKLRGRLEYILAHKYQFEPFDEDQLRAQLLALDARFPLWAQRAKACVQDAAQCSLSGLEPMRIALPARLQSTDPLDAKWQDILTYDSRTAEHFQPNFLSGTSITQYDRGPRGGRFKLFRRDPAGAPTAGVFWHPELGAHAVYGPIFESYAGRGLAEGPLGYPVSDAEVLGRLSGGDGLDRISHFENGFLWVDAQTGVVADRLAPVPERPFEPAPRRPTPPIFALRGRGR
jgi:hypothetical protein